MLGSARGRWCNSTGLLTRGSAISLLDKLCHCTCDPINLSDAAVKVKEFRFSAKCTQINLWAPQSTTQLSYADLDTALFRAVWWVGQKRSVSSPEQKVLTRLANLQRTARGNSAR
jgi:hypothetical protein